MPKELQGHRVAILATDGVEQSELTEPWRALEQAGARVDLVSLKPGRIQAMKHLDKAETFAVDRTVADASSQEYDALVLPGGVANPDRLRMDVRAVQLVRDFLADGKPIAAICHAPWMLVEADAVRHRTLTSWPSLQTDIRNAGGHWVDQEVCIDQRIITSRKPDDLPVFCKTILLEFGKDHYTHRADAHSPTASDREDHGALVDVSSSDSFPASDPPSSLKVT